VRTILLKLSRRGRICLNARGVCVGIASHAVISSSSKYYSELRHSILSRLSYCRRNRTVTTLLFLVRTYKEVHHQDWSGLGKLCNLANAAVVHSVDGGFVRRFVHIGLGGHAQSMMKSS